MYSRWWLLPDSNRVRIACGSSQGSQLLQTGLQRCCYGVAGRDNKALCPNKKWSAENTDTLYLYWWLLPDSNRGHKALQASALPTELKSRNSFAQ